MNADFSTVERTPRSFHAPSEIHRGAIDQILRTILGIGSISDPLVPRKRLGKYRKSRHADNGSRVPIRVPQPARLEIVDRPSRATVTVCWSDALSGHYADQVWRLGRSRSPAFCVLTGAPILVGDRIFRPLCQGASAPGNRDAMIRADAICVDMVPYGVSKRKLPRRSEA